MSDDLILDDPTLANPDVEEVDSKYKWDEEFQRHIIALLLLDRQFLLQSIDLVKPSYFTNKVHQKACSLAFTFFRKYRLLPRKDFLVQEVKSSLKDNKALPYYLGEVNVIFDYFKPGLDAREYLIDKITYFAKMQAFRSAFQEGLKLLGDDPESEENWGKIYQKIEDVVTTTANFDLGINYLKSVKDRYKDLEAEEDENSRFIWGLESIDSKIGGGGYSIGEMVSVIAGSGVGKSVLLACLTATNLLRGKKGVYITLELAEEKVAERLDAILTGFDIRCLCDNKDEIFEKLDSLEGVNYEDEWQLAIKQFPSGTATVNKIRAYLSQLKFHGFNPDFVVIDYVGEMAPVPGLPTHEGREQIVRNLRGMAMEEELFVATAMQPNREGKGGKDQKSVYHRIDDQHLADSYGQIRPLDGAISLNQTDLEHKLGIGRCFNIKQRDGESRFQIFLKFDKDNLRITEIHEDTYKRIMSAHKELVSEEVEIDKVKDGWKPSSDDSDQEEG